jgi:transcription antitermination factor NusG
MPDKFTDPPRKNWLAVTTKPNLEKIATEALYEKGLDAYLPLYRVRRRWSDRVKELELPLFPGYTFCVTNPTRSVFPTPGVTGVVSFGAGPALIPDSEIVAVRRAIESGLPMQPSPFIHAGQQVSIVYGPLAGIEGIVVKVKKQYCLVVSITMLQRSISVDIEEDWVRPVGTAPRSPRPEFLPLPT